VPLKIAYEDLFKMVRDPDSVVADHWVEDEWTVDFRRSLSVRDFDRWIELKGELDTVVLEEENTDLVIWGLEKKGFFSTKSLYRFITDGGAVSRIAGFLGKCRIPLKIKIFLWQIFNQLQCAQSLCKRRWKGGDKCCLCGGTESVNHILFDCIIARMIWGFLREIFKWNDQPTSMKSLSETWLQGMGPLPVSLTLFIFAGFTWVIWNNRNKMAIEHKYPKSPTDIIYVALSYLQKWSILLKEADRQRIMQVKDEILCWMRNFKPSLVVATDVCEI
jgi:hypothetical protein